jgi:hypothetical protein
MHVFQVVAGVVNVVNYENKSVVQVRRISKTFTPAPQDVDLAIAKVNQPFLFINTVKGVTLADAAFTPPGNKNFIIPRNKKQLS